MATRFHATAAIRWNRTTRNDPNIPVSFVALDAFTDITEQPDPTAIATNVYLIDADLAQSTANAINTLITNNPSAPIFVLAQESYDDAAPDVRTGNYDAQPTAAQLTAFGTQLLARFPALTTDQLQSAGQNILRAGLTRREIINLLATRWRQL